MIHGIAGAIGQMAVGLCCAPPWTSGDRATVSTRRKFGFTLVELLVVLFIFLMLTAIALPTVKNLLADQKVSKTSRSITGFIATARSRAIAEGRYVGFRIERQSNLATEDYGKTVATRIRYLIGTPPYSGDSAGAKAEVQSISGSLVTLRFSIEENQLLSLNNQSNSPFKDKDIIELPGGKQFHLKFTANNANFTEAQIDLRQPLNLITGTGSVMFPQGNTVSLVVGNRYPYRVYRGPVPSTAAPLDFVRGVVLDLNYAGFGTDGFEFGPTSGVAADDIDVLFGPDGRVEFMTLDTSVVKGPPPGMIFFLLGDVDGVRVFDGTEATLFAEERRSISNILNSDSVWLVINPNTGRAVAAPLAQTSDTTSRDAALPFSRSLAMLSDTLDAEP